MIKHVRFLSSFLLLSVCVMLSAAQAAADDLQNDFLRDLSQGLKARWEYSSAEQNTKDKTFVEVKSEMVHQELDKIKAYDKETFEDTEFDELVHAYIEAVKLQLNSLKYYEHLSFAYAAQWEAGYKIRNEIRQIMTSKYGLAVDETAEEEIETETEAIASSEETTQTTAKGLRIVNSDDIQVVINEVQEDAFFVKVDITVKNAGKAAVLVTMKNDEITVNDITVPSPMYVEAGPGKSANTILTFDKKLTLAEIGTNPVSRISFALLVQDRDSMNRIYSGKQINIEVGAENQLTLKPMEVTKDTVKQVQELLNQMGYECGTPDGLAGSKTHEAILRYTKEHGLQESQEITEELLESLEAAVG